jgi:beta-glucosidase
LLNTILKDEWKFKGFVMSDWGGTHSTVDAANKGLDVEMGSGEKYNQYFFADKLLDSVKAGKVSMKTIDDKVRRVLWVMYQTSLSGDQSKGSINTTAHSRTAYDIASESIVLLENDKRMLPLNVSKIRSVAVIGDNATHMFHFGGFGAGVKARYEITPLQGLQNRLGDKVSINFAQGYSGDYHPHGGININTETKPADPAMIQDAVDAAKKSDIAILFIGGNRDYESESRDRKDLSLPFGEQPLVDAVTAANPNTIVVVIGGAPYDIGAIKKNNHTIVWSWYNGSENGNALADVLLGKINPSGKLPFTFPASLNESPAHSDGEEVYPGKSHEVVYKEGILVGYRWFDTKNIEPLYPFGYGLSYTNFKYSGIRTNKKAYGPNEAITVSVDVQNTGNYSGKETVQLYVSKPNSKVDRSEKELKAFKKIMIGKGQTAMINIAIPVKDLAYFDTNSMKWIVEPGEYKILAGTSSRDIKQTVSVTINE